MQVGKRVRQLVWIVLRARAIKTVELGQVLGEDAAKQITNDTHRGIRMFEWAMNNKCVLYLQGTGQLVEWGSWNVRKRL